MVLLVPAVLVSIHAPVRMRLAALRELNAAQSFNSRTREDATRQAVDPRGHKEVSIHAPVRMRRKTLNDMRKMEQFQFTHP